MAWIESHQELARHPKTRRLARLLGTSVPAAIGHLQLLWWWAMDFAPDGNLSAFDAPEIAEAMMWEGDPEVLLDGLMGAKFVDEAPGGEGYVIHDWDDYAGRLIDKRQANAQRMREARAKHVQSTSGARAGATVPDRTQPDCTQPDRSTTPQPPPQAEGERPKRRRRRDEPVEIPITPLTETDRALWESALTHLSRGMLPALFAGVVKPMAPVGRAPDGGLLLRSPPSVAGRAVTLIETLGRALEAVGDGAGSRAAIVE